MDKQDNKLASAFAYEMQKQCVELSQFQFARILTFIEHIESEAQINILEEVFKDSTGVDFHVAHKSDAGMIDSMHLVDKILNLLANQNEKNI